MSLKIKRCVIGSCSNTSITAPYKVFLNVDCAQVRRTSWFKSISKQFHFCPQSVHCCEDHFILKNDLSNWEYFRTIGSVPKLKKGAIPHIFFKSTCPDRNYSQFSASDRQRKLENLQNFYQDNFKSQLEANHIKFLQQIPSEFGEPEKIDIPEFIKVEELPSVFLNAENEDTLLQPSEKFLDLVCEAFADGSIEDRTIKDSGDSRLIAPERRCSIEERVIEDSGDSRLIVPERKNSIKEEEGCGNRRYVPNILKRSKIKRRKDDISTKNIVPEESKPLVPLSCNAIKQYSNLEISISEELQERVKDEYNKINNINDDRSHQEVEEDPLKLPTFSFKDEALDGEDIVSLIEFHEESLKIEPCDYF